MPYAEGTALLESPQQAAASSYREKVIPQNNEAEKAVLAAMILDSEILEEAFLAVREEAFYRPSHQKIYRAMLDLHSKGNPVDQITLAERLEAKGELEQVGGRAYILELANNSFALANWAYHAQIVNRQHLLRKLIEAATRISALSYDAPDDTKEVVEQAEKLIFDVTDKEVKSSFRGLSELMTEAVEQMDRMAKEKKHIQGVPTGYQSIDRIL